MRRLLWTICGLWCSLWAMADLPMGDRNMGTPTEVAPGLFGPNAFPVPDMLTGRVDTVLVVEAAADGYWGYAGGRQTADLFARMRVPLFTPRVNLSLWMPVQEWYRDSLGTGHGTGDVYLSTDIQVWKGRRGPDVALRIGVKTASGEQYERRRHFDSPGYWFDASVGKSWVVREVEMRIGGTAGFLCWQTGVQRQNDAFYYGLQAMVRYRYIEAAATWSGYAGWEKAGDRPMVLRARIAGRVKGFVPYMEYAYGIKDYPYHHGRVGLAYEWNVLRYKSKK